jgi:hypothetical protein
MNIAWRFAAFCLVLSAGPALAFGPYAGEQHREIKSVSATEAAELLDGAGRGFAKAAELNGYPGPAHVIDHADALALSPSQRKVSQDLLVQHKDRARSLGAAVLAAERGLDEAFATRRIDVASLDRQTAAIGSLLAQLRAEHLRTHLAQTDILTSQQIEKYARLRGYAGEPPAEHGRPRH